MFLLCRVMPKIAACLLMALCWRTEARAAERQLQLRWTDLAQEVVGRKISTQLTGGVKVEGKVTSVTSDGLVLEVAKTSDRVRYAGNASLPRSLVTSLRVSRRGWKWRVIGPVVGALTLGLAGAAIGGRVNPEGGFGFIPSQGAAKGATVGTLSGLGAGYIVGHFADRHTVFIEIKE